MISTAVEFCLQTCAKDFLVVPLPSTSTDHGGLVSIVYESISNIACLLVSTSSNDIVAKFYISNTDLNHVISYVLYVGLSCRFPSKEPIAAS